MPALASFPSSRRIKRRRDFLLTQGKGRKVRSKHFILALTTRTDGDTRLGITISTKVSKRAVRRNLLRRRIRELFRTNLSDIPGKHDAVLIALIGATELEFEELKAELCTVLRLASRGGSQRERKPK